MSYAERRLHAKISAKAHKEIKNMLLSSNTFEEFTIKLNEWADKHLEVMTPGENGELVAVKGRKALPTELQVSNELNTSPRAIYNK